MSTSKKKVVVTTSSKAKVRPTVSKSKSKRSAPSASRRPAPLIFKRTNYILMLAGIALVALGLILMSGGGMENPNEWKAEEIYSTRRTVVAPFVIILGLVVEIVAIFRKEKTKVSTEADI